MHDYDAGTGRLKAKIPILFNGADVNFYAYVRNDLVSLVDPKYQQGEDYCYCTEIQTMGNTSIAHIVEGDVSFGGFLNCGE